MLTKTLLILGPATETRLGLERLLTKAGWRCFLADDLTQARTFAQLDELRVALLGDAALCDKFCAAAPRAQVVLYDLPNRAPQLASTIFGVLSPESPEWQVQLMVDRAWSYSESVKSQHAAEELVTSSYKSLFEASAELTGMSSLQELLDLLCREIARCAEYKRVILVLADQRFRIEHAAAFSQDETPPNLDALRGQPLAPVRADRLWSRVGRGYLEPVEQYPIPHALIIPLERQDGTVVGYLTLDLPIGDQRLLAELSEPIALILRHGLNAIEIQALRKENRRLLENEEGGAVQKNSELRQVQERFLKYLSQTDDVIYITDEQGRIGYLNDAFTSELGYARENFVGRAVPAVFSELAVENAANAALIASLESGQTEFVAGDLELFTKDGHRRAFRLTHRWNTQAENRTGQGFLRNVTERRDLLQRLATFERLSFTGRLATGIAHEINNPLQAISAHLSGLQKHTGSDEKFVASLSVVADSVDRIRVILRNLLDLQRTEAAARAPIQLNDVVTKTQLLLQPQLKQSEVECVVTLEDDLPLVEASFSELEQVLINLVLNASEAMQERGSIHVVTARAEGAATIEVRDDGPGIPPDILPKIFEPFATFRKKGGGTGLGLYLSQQIVRQHGGELTVSSELGKGTTFTITLPIKE